MIAAVLLAATVTVGGDQKVFIYGQDRPVIACSQTVSCDITFCADDAIQDIVTGDSKKRHNDGWIIARGIQGDLPSLYLTPNKLTDFTNLVVTTTKRTYRATLVAQPSSEVTSYRFLCPDETGAINVLQTPAPHIITSTPTPAPEMEPIAPLAQHMQWTGDPTLMPTRALRLSDRVQLVFALPNGASAPGIAALDEHGNLVGINTVPDVKVQPNGEILTVDIYDLALPIVIYRGEGSAQRRLVLKP